MNSRIFFLLLSLATLSVHPEPVDQSVDALAKPASQPYLIDTIKVIIYGQEGTELILQSDVARPNLDGTFRTLEELIDEALIFMDAQRFKMLPGDEQIDQQLKMIQRENNLTMEQLKGSFKAAGYTYEEGRRQFMKMIANGSVVEFRIRNRLGVPDKEVQEFYEKHPEKEPKAYCIQRVMIPYPSSEKIQQEMANDLRDYAATGVGYEGLEWSSPFWINEADLAEDKQPIIMALQKDQIAQPIKTQEGFELFRLVDKKEERVVPLQERYKDIVNLLRKPRYEKMIADYKKQLRDAASIVYM